MAIGIIAEYNPFHSGHFYQISETKKMFNEEIIVLMSGNFSQRGEPAILDKWSRAILAVKNGADLVFELPFLSAVRNAQNFATNAIKIFENLNVVNKLVFGAEISDLKTLQNIAKINFDKIKFEMSAGISYAKAAEKILQKKIPPNSILALEYLRNLPENIQPVLIPRIGANYNDKILQKISSASAIRTEIYKKNPDWQKISQSVDEITFLKLREEKFSGLVREDFLFNLILAKIINTSQKNLQNIFGMNEGIENLFLKAAKSAKNFSELINFMTSKRYQISRLKRLFLYFLLDVNKNNISELENVNYARVLAFNKNGQKILKNIAKISNIKIITKTTQHLTEKNLLQENFTQLYQKKLAFDVKATNLYQILFDSPKNFGKDFVTSPKFCA